MLAKRSYPRQNVVEDSRCLFVFTHLFFLEIDEVDALWFYLFCLLSLEVKAVIVSVGKIILLSKRKSLECESLALRLVISVHFSRVSNCLLPSNQT